MIRRPPRSTQSRSSAASDVYKRQGLCGAADSRGPWQCVGRGSPARFVVCSRLGCRGGEAGETASHLSLIHISEPTRRTPISYAVFCLKKKKHKKHITYAA